MLNGVGCEAYRKKQSESGQRIVVCRSPVRSFADQLTRYEKLARRLVR